MVSSEIPVVKENTQFSDILGSKRSMRRTTLAQSALSAKLFRSFNLKAPIELDHQNASWDLLLACVCFFSCFFGVGVITPELNHPFDSNPYL